MEYVKPVFFNSSGVLITRGLFLETSPTTEYVCYTLSENDLFVEGIGYLKSIKAAYMASEDPTEYTFIKENFYNLTHWKNVLKLKYFQENYEDWKEEHELALRSFALSHIMKVADDEGSKSYFTANRFLVDRGFKSNDDKVGRPSKEKIKEQAELLFEQNKDIENDWERINGQ